MTHHATSVEGIASRCGGCGYLLRGLPEDGRCPECGAAYGPDVLVLWGEHGDWGDNAFQRVYGPMWDRRHWWKIGQQFVWLWGVILAGAFIVTGPAWPSTLTGGLMLALLAWTEWRMLRSWRGWQVRLARDGYGQRPGFGRVRIRPWGKDLKIDVRRVASGFYVLTIRHLYTRQAALLFPYPDDAVAALKVRIERLAGQHVGMER